MTALAAKARDECKHAEGRAPRSNERVMRGAGSLAAPIRGVFRAPLSLNRAHRCCGKGGADNRSKGVILHRIVVKARHPAI